jgi:hypothetical protein
MPGTIRRVDHSFNLNNVKPTQCIPTDQSLSNGTKLEAGDKRRSHHYKQIKQSTFLSLIDRLEYRSGKGIHLLIIISGQGEKLETKLGL